MLASVLILVIVLAHSVLGTSLLCFYFYSLCYAAVLLKFACYAQYHAQEQELLSNYVAIDLQFCMTNLLNVADNLILTVLLECIYESMLYHMLTVLLEYINCSLQFSTNA